MLNDRCASCLSKHSKELLLHQMSWGVRGISHCSCPQGQTGWTSSTISQDPHSPTRSLRTKRRFWVRIRHETTYVLLYIYMYISHKRQTGILKKVPPKNTKGHRINIKLLPASYSVPSAKLYEIWVSENLRYIRSPLGHFLLHKKQTNLSLSLGSKLWIMCWIILVFNIKLPVFSVVSSQCGLQ